MTDRPHTGAGSAAVGTAAVGTVAWLEVVADDGSARLSAISGGECLTVAATVLAAAAGWRTTDRRGPGLGERLASVADHVPALAAWGAARFFPSVPRPSGTTLPAEGDAAVLEGLAAALVIPGMSRAIAVARDTAPMTEAVVLRDAVAVALEQVRQRGDFDRAVAAARLEAMRELAYGAGHEINNPLANIATRAQALLLEEADPERRRRLSTILDQSFRARDMIGGLMLFARPPKPRPAAVDVGGVVAAAIEAVRGQAAARGARLEYSPPPVPISVFVDRVQIEEVMRMLLVNALEAVASGGRVMIAAGRRIGDGRWCEIGIVDDGQGMTADAASRAFDPFFSGREAGRGAGLGLPKAWRLVELNGGTMSLDSRLAGGTRLVVLLPEVEPAAISAASGR